MNNILIGVIAACWFASNKNYIYAIIIAFITLGVLLFDFSPDDEDA